MNKQSIQLLLSGIIISLPVFTTVEAKADNHAETSSDEMEMMEKTNSEAEDNLDSGYDGEPVVTLPETEGEIKVIVKNNTNAVINYQAVGFTENQTLKGGEEYTLEGLPVPVVIRAARQDEGFITTEPTINDNGILEVALDEAGERNLGVVRIEQDGGVYINKDTEANMSP